LPKILKINYKAVKPVKRRVRKCGNGGVLYPLLKKSNEILCKQADGFKKLVEAAGGDANKAALLMIADKLPEIVKTQVEAITNLKIDKITVWDSMGHDGASPTTANFLAGMLKSVPPLDELFRTAGLQLPNYLGEQIKEKAEPHQVTPDNKSAK
jgi:flotillin